MQAEALDAERPHLEDEADLVALDVAEAGVLQRLLHRAALPQQIRLPLCQLPQVPDAAAVQEQHDGEQKRRSD